MATREIPIIASVRSPLSKLELNRLIGDFGTDCANDVETNKPTVT